VAAKAPPSAQAAASDPSACECQQGSFAGDLHGAVNVVVYRGADNHVYELALKSGSGWQLSDITKATSAPPAVGNPFVSDSNDGDTSVVYRSADGHIYELAWSDQSASWALNVLWATPSAAGDPVGYNRSGGVAAVVFRGSDGHIYELSRLEHTTTWGAGDLTKLTAAPTAAGDPFGYLRSDGVNAVVYRATDGRIHELSLGYGPGAKWEQGILP
jgi:hypothetical protein